MDTGTEFGAGRPDGPLHPVALVTGAASGIGLAVAQRLSPIASGGLMLIDRDGNALEAAADSLPRTPERVSTMAMDVADEARWRQASDFIESHYGRLDWAVISAGVAHSAPLEELSFSDWRSVMSVNLDGAFLTLRAVMPLMKRNAHGGGIVALSSAAGLKAEPGIAAYGASKAGLIQLTKVAAKEGAPHNVRVNALAPGGVETPMWRSVPMFQDLVRETGSEKAAFLRIAQEATPLGRYSTPDEIARIVEMLLADSPSITGAVIVIDGGYTL